MSQLVHGFILQNKRWSVGAACAEGCSVVGVLAQKRGSNTGVSPFWVFSPITLSQHKWGFQQRNRVSAYARARTMWHRDAAGNGSSFLPDQSVLHRFPTIHAQRAKYMQEQTSPVPFLDDDGKTRPAAVNQERKVRVYFWLHKRVVQPEQDNSTMHAEFSKYVRLVVDRSQSVLEHKWLFWTGWYLDFTGLAQHSTTVVSTCVCNVLSQSFGFACQL